MKKKKQKVKKIVYFGIDLALIIIGLIVGIILSATSVKEADYYRNYVGITSIIMLSFIFVLLIVEIVSWAQISDSTYHTALISLFLFFYYLTTVDFECFLDIVNLAYNKHVFDYLNYTFFILLNVILLFFINYTYFLKWNKIELSLVFIFAFLLVGLYVGLSFVNYNDISFQFIAYLISLFLIIWYCLYIYKTVNQMKKINFVFFFTAHIIACILGSGLVDTFANSKVLKIEGVGIPLIYTAIIITCFLSIYVNFVIHTERNARKTAEYQLKYESIQTKALRQQINQHFIFNLLSSIKTLYHEDIQEGDEAIDLFSKHLRAHVDAIDEKLIPFSKELENLQTYIELENLRHSCTYNVIFDIDYMNFNVPVFSLQPYIENSIRYSQIEKKEDGMIIVSSYIKNDTITIKIEDNGVGFDIDKVKNTSQGIKNSKERFKLMLNTIPLLQSEPNKGTIVTINIPLFDETAGGGRKI